MDFDKFAEGTPDVDVTDPLALYKTLDRERSHVELRPGQEALLEAWAIRRNERDLVLKLATGAGKTTTGLLMLYSHMRETRRPCLFLCPTNQLVDQVAEESKRCGVPAVTVTGGAGEIPPEALMGEAVLITSVQNVFQARAGHFKKAAFYAILIDDAHAAIDIVRQKFRLTFPHAHPVYKKLRGLFKDALKNQNMGAAAAIDAEYSVGAVEVPYWAWAAQLDAVSKILTDAAKAEDAAYKASRANHSKHTATDLPFTWGLISSCLMGMRCAFSEVMVEIAPEVCPVDRVQTYDRAERRIFMSATISDESVLVRELACSPAAANTPIELEDAGGMGERMVLVPRLMAATKASSITWPHLATLCSKVAKKHAVVILTPTRHAAEQWQQITGAEVVLKSSDVPKAVRDLLALRELRGLGPGKLVVFANRYDGIDLPDGACRLLVLDGAPMAYSLMDSIDAACRGAASVRRRAVMHKIEQGLGRAVRSPSDYSAIILFGNDLVALISHVETRSELTHQTRKQIEFGLEIAKGVKQQDDGKWQLEVETLINQCLGRDPGWKRAYQTKVKLVATAPDVQLRASRIEQAWVERTAWEKFINNQGADGAEIVHKFVNTNHPGDDIAAFLLQRAAWYVRNEEPARSLEWQRWAREHDPQLLMPPEGVKYVKRAVSAKRTAVKVLEWLNEYDNLNAAIACVEDVRSQLIFSPEASTERFEQALCDLGRMLGLDSSRPEREFRDGPDVLWMEGQTVVPLEAKSGVGEGTTAISKHDAGQLTQSAKWAADTYPERQGHVPMIAHTSSVQGENARLPDGTRVLTPKHLTDMLDALGALVAAASHGPRDADEIAKLLVKHRLTLPQILAERTAKVT